MSSIDSRKATQSFRLVDSEGNALKNKTVNITQTNHKFLFGCGAFEAVPYTNPVNEERVKRQFGFRPDRKVLEDRMETWLGLFNYGTLPFYWGQFEPVEGSPRTDELMRTAKFLKSKDVEVKGHTLCWQTVHAAWLLDYDLETIIKKQLDRIHREVSDFKGVVDIWDVINEVCIMPVYDRYDNAATRMCKAKGRVGLCKLVFDAAAESNENGIFLINDFNTSNDYARLVEECLEAGVPIKTIGIQSHQHQRIWGEEKLEEVLARFERFNLPIHFTENTIVAAPLVDPKIDDLQDAHYDDDAATPEYEAMQAEELEKMYRRLFENHPLVTAITNWDFGDGAWLNAPSGLIRKDGSLKPSYNTLHRLIKEEWHTDATLKTDDNGFITLEGFKGTYEVRETGQKLVLG